jgi:hypothetical protein
LPDGGSLGVEEALDLFQQPGGDVHREGDAGEALGEHRAAGEGAALSRSTDALFQHVHRATLGEVLTDEPAEGGEHRAGLLGGGGHALVQVGGVAKVGVEGPQHPFDLQVRLFGRRGQPSCQGLPAGLGNGVAVTDPPPVLLLLHDRPAEGHESLLLPVEVALRGGPDEPQAPAYLAGQLIARP